MTWQREAEYDYEQTPLRERARWLFDSFRKLSLWSEGVQGALGYGGLIQRTNATIPDITAGTYQTIPFDEGMVQTPYLVNQDPANDRFSIDASGIWIVASYGIINHDKFSGNRKSFVRFYNITTSAPVTTAPFPVFTDNQRWSSWSYFALFEAPQSIAGDWLRMELGGSSANMTSVSVDKVGLTIMRIPSQRSAIVSALTPRP